jgi:hypothetical protein
LDNPAVSCYDLHLDHKLKNNTQHYIDPNGGKVEDAIKVTCRQIASQWSTCLNPEDPDQPVRYQIWSLSMHSQKIIQTINDCSEEKSSKDDSLHTTVDKCRQTVTTEVPFTVGTEGEICFV